MSKYQPYPEYKDSEIEWLGTIPSHWVRTNLKRYCQVTDGSHHSPKIESDGYPFVSVTDVGVNTINFSDAKRISPQNYDRLVQEGCKPSVGDLLLTKDGTIGRACVVNDSMPDFVILSSLGLLTPTDKLLNNYLYYYLISGINVDQMNSMIHGSALKRMTISKIDELILLLPSNEEQTQIVAFLDHETAKIDTLIEKQQKLIELLKEKRQAVISHAVTKGLNPDAPMKDSGVEWLGEVPEHWSQTSVRNLIRSEMLQVQDGNHGELHPVANDYVDDGIPFLMANNVRNGMIDIINCKKIPKTLADKLRIGFAKAGDMLLTHKGTVGEVGIIPQYLNEEYWMLTPQVTYYRWNSKKLINKYFYYQYQSSSVAIQLNIIGGKQSTRAYVGIVAQGDIILVIPPKEEQKEIALKLKNETSKYDYSILKADSAISLLKERRTALISAAVTGKIDVRHWVAPTTSSDANEAQQEVTA